MVIHSDLRKLHELVSAKFGNGTIVPIQGSRGRVGFLFRANKERYICGCGNVINIETVQAHRILFSCALAYDPCCPIILLVNNVLYQFDPRIMLQSHSRFPYAMLSLNSGKMLS